MRNIYEIIKRPIVSEKSSALSEVGHKYVFEVAPKAKKNEIKRAVEELFKVDVERIHTLVVHGKFKQVGRVQTKRSNWKKAIVTIKEGQKIELFQSR